MTNIVLLFFAGIESFVLIHLNTSLAACKCGDKDQKLYIELQEEQLWGSE